MIKNKPLIGSTLFSLTSDPMEPATYKVNLEEDGHNMGNKLLIYNSDSQDYQDAICNPNFTGKIDVYDGSTTTGAIIANCNLDSTKTYGVITCYNNVIDKKETPCCSTYDSQRLAYLYGYDKNENKLYCSTKPPPKSVGFSAVDNKCMIGGVDGSKNNYNKDEQQKCEYSYTIHESNENAQKIYFPNIPDSGNNKSDTFHNHYSLYNRYSINFYNTKLTSNYEQLASNIYLMTDFIPMTACNNNNNLYPHGVYAFMDCSKAKPISGTTFAPCAKGNTKLQIGINDPSHCRNSWAGCSGDGIYTSEDTRNEGCGAYYTYGKFGYLSNDPNNNPFNSLTVLPNQKGNGPDALAVSIIPVAGYEMKDPISYTLTTTASKINYYCVYRIEIAGLNLVVFNDGACRLRTNKQNDPTNYMDEWNRNRISGLFAFGQIPGRPDKVGLVALDPSKFHIIPKTDGTKTPNYYWNPDGNISANTDTDMDLRKQVYPFVNSNSSENYLGWLSFKSIGNVWLGKEMTSTGISFLWVTKYGDGDHGENTIITGYTRNNSNKQ